MKRLEQLLGRLDRIESHLSVLVETLCAPRVSGQFELLPSEAQLKATASKKAHPIPMEECERFLDLWNSMCHPLPKVKTLTADRVRAIRRVLLEQRENDYWMAVMRKIHQSDFLSGRSKSGGTGWRANLDFLIRPGIHVRIMEGVYDGNGTSTPARGIYDDRFSS